MTIYYMSPTGLNTNTGLSPSSPWKTFLFVIPNLVAGDTLILMDGTYTGRDNISGTGCPHINASSPKGVIGNPITMKALNERKALIKADGNPWPCLHLQYSAYWTFEGLRFEGGDGLTGTAAVNINNSNNIIFKRILATKSDRNDNNHLIIISSSKNCLVEESEFYEFHRHGVFCVNSENIILRRNYSNSRNYKDIPGYASGDSLRGDEAFSFYPSKNSLQENNIGETVMQAFTQHGTGLGESDNNRFFGNIALNVTYGGFKSDGRRPNPLLPPSPTNKPVPIYNSHYKDNVVINANYGFAITDTINTLIENSTVIGIFKSTEHPDWPIYGYLLSGYTTTNKNNKVINSHVVSPLGIGFGGEGWTFDYTNVYGGVPIAWNPPGSETNSTQIDPNLGNYKIIIPPTSPMKGAGLNGADIGANIVFRYQDGILTNVPLWDTITGEFPHGAIIEGVNDNTMPSACNVHLRLGTINNTCPILICNISITAVQ